MTSHLGDADPFRFRSRADFAAERLKLSILRGDLEPGQRLIPATLCEAWGISQTPMREAFQRLAASGLIELIDQKGARVAAVSPADCEDLFGLRSHLEGRGLRQSLECATPQWRSDLTTAFERLSISLHDDVLDDGEKMAAFDHAHSRFHLSLLSGAPSRWLLHTIESLMDNSLRYRMRTLGPRGGAQALLLEHKGLLEAALQGRADDLIELNHQHLWKTVTIMHELELSRD